MSARARGYYVPTHHDLQACRTFLARLAEGQEVWVDANPSPMTVAHTLHTRSWNAFGSSSNDPDASRAVTLTYGPGRYSTDVSVQRLALGLVVLRLTADGPIFRPSDPITSR